MLDGYDNPNPTPRPPLNGLDFNHRFPRGPIKPVKPLSERIQSHILRLEADDRKPRNESLIIIPEEGIWRKIGNKTFYRLHGLHYIHHSNYKNGIQEAIDRANSRVFVRDATYPVNTNIAPKTGIYLEGETSAATVLKANANNLKLLSMATALPQNSVRLLHFGFDSGTFTGVTGVDFNQTNQEVNQTTQNNFVHDLQFFRNFTTLVDMTGCEASVMDLIWADNATCLAGEVYAKTFNGDITVSRLIWPQPGGTSAALHVIGNQVKVYNSVLNQIVVENQLANSITYTNTILLSLRDLFLANSQPAGVHKLINNGNQTNTVNTIDWMGCYIGLKNSSAAFASSGTGSLICSNANFRNCNFNSLDATPKWVSAPAGSIMTMGKKLTWENNFLTGTTIAIGDPQTGGWGQFDFQPPPAGWSLTRVPAVPVGTGVANARRCFYPRPVRIYAAGTISGTHIIDSGPLGDGANPVDTLVGIDPTVVQLDYGEQIWYATTVPSSWKWYGL
ncbi:MAG TPA: hypothetical protein VFE98_02940 [Candidatus Bathyarchaeia archaeon]|nr:hypothetical protein [Candidatus Bathyarchaeia archaeon]